MGVNAPRTANKIVFLDLVRSEIVDVWSSSFLSKLDKMASGSLSMTETMAEIFVGLKERECGGTWW